jgi:hypothetical protein
VNAALPTVPRRRLPPMAGDRTDDRSDTMHRSGAGVGQGGECAQLEQELQRQIRSPHSDILHLGRECDVRGPATGQQLSWGYPVSGGTHVYGRERLGQW